MYVDSLFPTCSSRHKLKTAWRFSHQLHVTSTSPASLSMLVRIRSRVAVSLVASSFLGNKIACRASQELVRCLGVSSMRCFIGLDFLGGRNSARAALGKRGLMSSQNLGESRSSRAGLRGPRGQQVGLLPAPFCAWPHALLIQTDCLPVRGRRARPAPGHRGHSEAPETPRSLTLAACPHPGQGRETAMGEQAKHLSSPNPSFPL